jgi:hypothetical protein
MNNNNTTPELKRKNIIVILIKNKNAKKGESIIKNMLKRRT